MGTTINTLLTLLNGHGYNMFQTGLDCCLLWYSRGFLWTNHPLWASLCSISTAVLSHVLKYNPESTVCVVCYTLRLYYTTQESCTRLYWLQLFHLWLCLCQNKPQKCGSHVIKLSTRKMLKSRSYMWLTKAAPCRMTLHCRKSGNRSKAFSIQRQCSDSARSSAVSLLR